MTNTLINGPMRLSVRPECGGTVLELNYHDRPLLRSGSATDIQNWDARNFAAFPMAPFIGRIFNGRCDFNGHSVSLEANMPPEPHAIHGFGWQAAWQIDSLSEHELVISQSKSPARWPWPYRATQAFALSDTGLELTLSLINMGETIMPAGLGWHPYFNRDQAILKIPVSTLWRVDEETGFSTADTRSNVLGSLKTGSHVEALTLDHAFSLSDPELSIIWPDLKLEIKSDPVFRHAVIYVPENENFFCVEPVSQIPNAINLPLSPAQTGLVSLAPGESLSGQIRLQATRLENP